MKWFNLQTMLFTSLVVTCMDERNYRDDEEIIVRMESDMPCLVSNWIEDKSLNENCRIQTIPVKDEEFDTYKVWMKRRRFRLYLTEENLKRNLNVFQCADLNHLCTGHEIALNELKADNPRFMAKVKKFVKHCLEVYRYKFFNLKMSYSIKSRNVVKLKLNQYVKIAVRRDWTSHQQCRLLKEIVYYSCLKIPKFAKRFPRKMRFWPKLHWPGLPKWARFQQIDDNDWVR